MRRKIVLVNAEVERLFGYPREELFGKTIDILGPRGTRSCMSVVAMTAAASGALYRLVPK
jgi:PAS domain S-box-containing protein